MRSRRSRAFLRQQLEACHFAGRVADETRAELVATMNVCADLAEISSRPEALGDIEFLLRRRLTLCDLSD